MPNAKQGWTPSMIEQARNVAEYGDSVPWTCIETQPIYEVRLCTAVGVEVHLTHLKTYKHTRTDEEREWVRPDGETRFVFNEDWPDDGVLEVGPVQHRPYGEVPR